MTILDFLGIIEKSDRIRITKDGKDLYTGWAAMLSFDKEKAVIQQYGGAEVKKFRAIPEIRHREWEERGLMKPLEPDKTPDYAFSDLQMKLYYEIRI